MTIALCVLLAILLFLCVALTACEVMSVSRIHMSWSLHGISLLLIVIALATHGIWYDADTYLGDLWTAFEALHKTQQGLVSSRDYFSPLGPAVAWVYGLTLLVHTPSATSIVLGNTLIAIVALILTALLLRVRATSLTIAVVGLIAVTTALSPRDIDLPQLQSSFLAPYNRWAWALLLPVVVRIALPFTRRDRLGTWLLGPAIAFLMLLKITYAIAAIGVFGVAVAVQPQHWREGAIAAATFAALLVIIDLITHGQVRAYLADLRMTAHMASNGLRPDKLLLQLPSLVLFESGTLILLFAASRGGDIQNPRQSLVAHWRALVLAGTTGSAGIFILMQNHYYTEATTLLLMPLVVAEWTGLVAAWQGQRGAIWRNRGDLIALLLLVTLARPAVDFGMVLAQPLQLMRKGPSTQLAGTDFRDLVVDSVHLPSAGQCTDSTCNDERRLLSGGMLLRSFCMPAPDRSVLAANFSNPFPTLLGKKSPRASPIWLHADRSFSALLHTPYDRLFADVDCLMEARDESNAALFMQIYGGNVRRDFTIVAENRDWILWKRNATNHS